MSVEEKVKSIIVEQLGVDANEVTPEASFVDDLGADSLDTVELVMAFEEAFNIERTTACESRKAPVRLVARTRSHASRDMRSSRLSSVRPALLTRMSTWP